jgi:hypothetical protein
VERGAGSGDFESGEQELLSEFYKYRMTGFFKNSIFGENYDLLPWVQKSLLLSGIEESTYEREGELKIKLEKERVRGTQKRDGELLKLKK